MFWGSFCEQSKFPPVFIDGYIDSKLYCKILRYTLLPKAKILFGNDFRILHDGSGVHRSKLTQNWLNNNIPHLIKIPAYSPQLNPIENLWRILKLNVEKRSPQNLTQLKQMLIEEWEKIPDQCRP